MSGSYVVLARKYRPQTFEEVVGQSPVSQTLLNALEAKKVAHAYIFSGPRGVGKTTTARILAKCLNCVKGPTKNPCNECDACRAISQGTSMDDVLEIDGASNRGIEQIRELRESAKYAPARSRYRIYIIDEAHQITKDAFGALLKTLEEPPAHVVFMMATTEAQKIPAPILSRCQRFSLRPIPPELVFQHLKEICKSEKVKVEDAALAHIVRFVEGSLRDALSLLDQAVVFAPEGINAGTISDLLGLLPKDVIRRFAANIASGDPAAILKTASEFVTTGIDLTQLGKDLQLHYHDLLLAKAGVEDTFKVEADERRKEAASFDYETLERNIRLLSRMLDDMRHSETPRAIFEVYALRLGQKTLDPRVLVERLEKLEAAAPSVARSFAAPPPPAPPAPSRPAPAPFRPPELKPPASREAASPPAPAAATPPPAGPADMRPNSDIAGAAAGQWSDVVNEILHTKQALGHALQEARLETAGDRLTLILNKTFSHQLISRSLDVLRESLQKRFGAVPAIDVRLEKAEAPTGATASRAERPPEPAPATTATPPRRGEPDVEFEDVPADAAAPEVQKALKFFPGKLKREKGG